ncbi:MAG TPA: hypothetical protein VFZ49_05215 [Pyrinomonadaceae bacterium]
MPNKRYPRKLIPHNYWPPPGIKHYFQTGERWESVAAKFGIPVNQLIYHNFKTTQKEEVNWYLNELIGCKYSTDGLNYAFKTGEGFGYIVIPASVVHMEPEVYEAPHTETEVERLKPLVKDIPGVEGQRIRCLLAKAIQSGSPEDERWWYYSSQPTLIYTEWRTTDQQRRWMTPLSPDGKPPFDGNSGAATGDWRTYPFRQLKIECINGCSDADLKHKIELIAHDFQKSYAYLARVDRIPQSSKSVSPLVKAFVKHVYDLSQKMSSLYSCGPVGGETLGVFEVL